MKTKETRTEFINRVMGLNFKSIQGKFSFCNDNRRQILFSLNLTHGENSGLILSRKWAKNGYAHSMKHIGKIVNEGYDLLVYKTRSITKNGKTSIIEFKPLLEKRKLTAGINGEYFASPTSTILPEEVSESGKLYFEGSKKQIVVNAYERDPNARQACIDAHGCSCHICGFNFESIYGERGKGFIHVHHIVPLSEIRKDYEIDPTNDLIPVCPNCHAMLHRGGHTIIPEELTIKKG